MRFLILILLFPFALSATEIDSLHHLISRTKPPLQNRHQYELHKAIGMAMIKRGAYDSAEVELREAIKHANGSNNPKILGKAYYNLGYLFDKKKDVVSSAANYKKSLEIFREIGDSTLFAQNLSGIGISYKRQGLKSAAISALLESLRYAATTDNDNLETRASSYGTLGNIYREMQEYDKALANHYEALKIRARFSNKQLVASCYNNLGNVYKEMCRSGYYKNSIGCIADSALYFYKHALLIRFKEGPIEQLANVYSNLGEVYFDKQDITAATSFFTKAYTIRSSENIPDGVAFSLIDLASLDSYHKRYKEAEAKLNEALLISKKLHLAEIEKDVYKKIFNLYLKEGDLKKAILYNQYYMDAKDSLTGIEKQKEIIDAEIEHKVIIMNQENQMLLLEQKQALTRDQLQEEQMKFQKRILMFLSVGAGLLLVLLIVSYYAFLLKKRSSLQHQTHMRELHHRVKNNLQMLSSLLSLQSSRVTDPLIKEAVRSSENRVRAMTLLHRKLYNEHNVMIINMPAYIGDLVHSLEDIYEHVKAKLILKIEVEEMDVDKAIPLGLIVNELVSNAFKYAFSNHPDPRLKVLFYLNADGKQVLVVEDNGHASDHTTDNDAGSYGLKLVNTLSEQLKATLSVRRDEGFRYELIIP